MNDRIKVPPPVSGVELSNHVAGAIVSITCWYERYGCDKPTTADALVMGAVAAAVEARGVHMVVAELRKLADNFEASSERIAAAMAGMMN